MTERRGDTLVEQDLHGAARSGSSDRKTALSVLENSLDLLARDAREPFQEIVDPCAAFKIFEERFDRNARAFEQPLAAHFAGNAFDRRAILPIKHDYLATGRPYHAGFA